MSNVVKLQRKLSPLEECAVDLHKMNPHHWLMVGYDPVAQTVKVMGPANFDVIVMLGMLDYARRCVEEQS